MKKIKGYFIILVFVIFPMNIFLANSMENMNNNELVTTNSHLTVENNVVNTATN